VRVVIKARCQDGDLILPLQYNEYIQGLIYRQLDSRLSGFLHDRGFERGKRQYRLFTFSRLLGRFRVSEGAIAFRDGVRLVVSSPWRWFATTLADGVLREGRLRLGPTTAEVDKVELESPEVAGAEAVFQTLSPVTVYSTLMKPDGGRYTCYYEPGEPEFEKLIGENLVRKYEALFQRKPSERAVRVDHHGRPRLSVIRYKGTIIKAYTCRLRISGPEELLQLGLDAGLGAKNSQGFGCMELVTSSRRSSVHRGAGDAHREPGKAG